MLTFSRRAPVADNLQSLPPFKGLSRARLRDITRLADHVKVAKGRTLIEEGQIGTEFFLILDGTVGVTNRGRRLNTLGSGDFFGELAALNRGRRNATVTALSDVELLVIGRRGHNAMLEIPEFRDALLKTLASRLQTVDALLEEWEESLTLASDGAQAHDVTAEYRDFTDDLRRGASAGTARTSTGASGPGGPHEAEAGPRAPHGPWASRPP